jgi:hypothetical protein
MKTIFKQFTHIEDTCSLHDVPSLYDKPYLKKYIWFELNIKQELQLTNGNQMLPIIFSWKLLTQKNFLTAYWYTQNKVARILCRKNPPCGGRRRTTNALVSIINTEETLAQRTGNHHWMADIEGSPNILKKVKWTNTDYSSQRP